MIKNAYTNRLNHLSVFLVVPVLLLTICSFRAKAVQINMNARMVADTVPANELKNIDWATVNRLTTGNGGTLLVDRSNGETLIIRRKDYEDYKNATSEPEEFEKIFTKLEIEAEYPGGYRAWTNFLIRNLRYPREAIDNRVQGSVVVQFIVDTTGNVIDIQAVSGPTTGGLRDEAIRLIKIGGKWNCGIQNFRLVKSYKKQVITFKLD